ncbi:MAG: hypothetical protein WBG90_14650 [Saonia sp.]
MAEKQPTNNSSSSDEIDLGQLFQIIGKGFKSLFRAFLGVFVYFKKNALILLGLGVIGIAVGYGLNQIVTKKLKTEVIVKPNMESKNYLYDAVDEIQANIKSKNTAFFKDLGIEIENFKGFEIAIAPANDGSKGSQDEIEYLELLQSFGNTIGIQDIVRAELLNKSSLNHRITIYYKDANKGQEFARKIMAYINDNAYFDELVEVYRANAVSRIAENKVLLQQVDGIIANYSKKMAQEDAKIGNDRIVLDNQEQIDITGLFTYKNNLIRDIEIKKLELQEQKEAISVINFGRPQQVQKSFFGKHIILLPSILIGLFFLVSIVKYLNKKATEMQA